MNKQVKEIREEMSGRLKQIGNPARSRLVQDYAYCELFKRKDVGHNILGPLQKLCDELKKLM